MSANDILAPGTLCYLVRVADYPELNGRICEIVYGPLDVLDGEYGPWYGYRAEWAEAEYPGCVPFAVRRCLRPIGTPDAVSAEHMRDSEPAQR